MLLDFLSSIYTCILFLWHIYAKRKLEEGNIQEVDIYFQYHAYVSRNNSNLDANILKQLFVK